MVAVIMDRIVFDSFVGISSGVPGQRTNASQCCHLVKMGKISTKVKSLKDIGYESFSDVGEIRVWFASKILTPCRMH